MGKLKTTRYKSYNTRTSFLQSPIPPLLLSLMVLFIVMETKIDNFNLALAASALRLLSLLLTGLAGDFSEVEANRISSSLGFIVTCLLNFMILFTLLWVGYLYPTAQIIFILILVAFTLCTFELTHDFLVLLTR